MTDYLINEGAAVTLHFALKLEDETVVDSTFEAAPASLVIGDGNLPAGFEKRLFGLRAGHREIFTVKPEDAFGMPNPNNVQSIPRKHFAEDMELEVGLMVSFADANQSELPGVIKSIDESDIEVDFNHPLAGRELLFEVEIIDVQPANEHAN